ncbi:MAG TPA: serine/threonine-protein kinase, partial [Kofleriaceae bacterium]|nr:serine/threonine-protein kinase [Kofleriaceae bacterium]
GSLAGEYRIEHKIGEGGMGTVYGARHTLIGKRAAIKVIRSELSANPNAIDRFVLEAQSVNKIGHPNIVDVFGFGQLDDGRRFFVMEWLQGESLRARLTRPLSSRDALEIFEDIAKALEAAHQAGVVHRDMKPDNVFLATGHGEKPIVKLLDFGLAKLSGPSEARIDRTRTGMVMGTPLYISPEQAKGTRIDTAVDIYSLGAIAYEMFCGRVPFMADSAVEIMSLHITQPLVPPREVAKQVPADLDALIVAMMAKSATERPTAAQVRTTLVAIRLRSSPSWVATPAPLPRPHRQHRGLVAGLVALGVVAGGVGVYLATHSPAPIIALAPIASPAPTPAPTPPPVPPQPAPVSVDPKPVEPDPTPVVAATPAKPTPSKPRTGTIVVKLAGGTKAEFFVDGRGVARGSEAKLELAGGEHELLVRSQGHKTLIKRIHVDTGARQAIELALTADANAVHDPFGDN